MTNEYKLQIFLTNLLLKNLSDTKKITLMITSPQGIFFAMWCNMIPRISAIK